jgi:excisionase family DNA binding protein
MLMNERRWNDTDLLSVAEAARVLRCSRQTVYRACAEHRIRWFQLREGGQIKIPFFALADIVGPRLLATVEQATAATSGKSQREPGDLGARDLGCPRSG